MTEETKLDSGQRHIIALINRGADKEGWAKVSEQLYPAVSLQIPSELAEFEKLEVGGRARLTKEGQCVFISMRWL